MWETPRQDGRVSLRMQPRGMDECSFEIGMPLERPTERSRPAIDANLKDSQCTVTCCTSYHSHRE